MYHHIHDESDEKINGQVPTVPATKNETNTNIVSYVTTVSGEGSRNDGGASHTDKEDKPNYIPDACDDEYSYAYMDAKGQKKSQFEIRNFAYTATKKHDANNGSLASDKCNERAEDSSKDGQQTYTALALDEVEDGSHDKTPNVYTQLKQDKRRGEMEHASANIDSNAENAWNNVYVNSTVVENMKKVKRF